MSATVSGALIGAVLAFAALQFGFWGFVVVVLFVAVGALVGRVLSGELDIRAVANAFTGTAHVVMSTIALDAGGAAVPVTATTGPVDAGRIEVRERVLGKIAQAASADALGVSRRYVRASVSEHRSGVSLRVKASLPVPDLDDDDAVASAPTVLSTARRVQEDLGATVTRILGREVTRIDLTIEGAQVQQTRRVR